MAGEGEAAATGDGDATAAGEGEACAGAGDEAMVGEGKELALGLVVVVVVVVGAPPDRPVLGGMLPLDVTLLDRPLKSPTCMRAHLRL